MSLFSCIIYAAEVENSKEYTTVSVNTQNNTSKTSIIESATDWSLTDAEWARYLQLIQKHSGRWYPQLTPPEVLGLNADTAEERQHFAQIAAKIEHEKIVRELAFNQAFYLAMRRLYPNEPMILDFDKTLFNPK